MFCSALTRLSCASVSACVALDALASTVEAISFMLAAVSSKLAACSLVRSDSCKLAWLISRAPVPTRFTAYGIKVNNNAALGVCFGNDEIVFTHHLFLVDGLYVFIFHLSIPVQ